MDGVIIIDKEENYTSRDVVNIISKIYHTKKVGHTGTLDPMATGVLVVCINKATKLVEILTDHDKEYLATFKLGVLTDTLDSTGNIISEEKAVFSKDEIIDAINKIKGKYMQEAPIYSAIKINGKKLYNYARNGIDIELPKREVNIYSIELINLDNDKDNSILSIKCHVSKGTYIRSLGNDIAKFLGTHAIMTSLRRTKQGDFTIENSIKLGLVSDNTKLISISDCLNNYHKVVAEGDLIRDIKNGKILDNCYNTSEILFVDGNNNALAIYVKYEKDINKIKPWKVFVTNM